MFKYNTKNEENPKKKNNILFQTNEENRLKEKGVSNFEIEGLKERERVNLISFINCFKFLSPILKKTQSIEDKDIQSEEIISYYNQANKFAILILNELKLSPYNKSNVWLINCLERIYTETYINENSQTGELPENIQNIIPFLTDFIVKKLKNEEFESFDFIEMEDVELKVKLAFISNINNILSHYFKYNLYISNQEYFINEVMDFLKKEVEFFFNEKVKMQSLLSSKDRSIFYLSLLKEISSIFVEIWKQESNQFFVQFSDFSDEEKEIWLKENPNGYPLSVLFKKSHEMASQLFNIVGIIIPKRNYF